MLEAISRGPRQIVAALAIAAAVATLAVVIVPISNASASDAFPCSAPWQHPVHGLVQTCPDWSPTGQIPVYYAAFPNSVIIDWIAAAGDDWYRCQMQTSGVHTLGSFQNNWWAFTKGDSGIWGWAPETYFHGGANFERDGGLAIC